jgi:hypothetical protein
MRSAPWKSRASEIEPSPIRHAGAAHSFVAEHCSKAVSFFLVVQFLLNGLAAASRLLGIPATDFAGPARPLQISLPSAR